MWRGCPRGTHRSVADVQEDLQGTDLLAQEIRERHRELGSVDFAVKLTREAKVAVSPGAGFGPGGDGHVRFALVENEHRIGQAIRGIRRALPELG